jgi:hypothetical protein
VLTSGTKLLRSISAGKIFFVNAEEFQIPIYVAFHILSKEI